MDNMWIYALIVIGLFLLFALIHRIAKNKKPFMRAFLSIICGPITLTAVNLIGSFFGIGLPVSVLSVFISAAGGIAGVTLMLALNLFF